MRGGTPTAPHPGASQLWWLLAAVLAGGSVIAGWMDPRLLDWQPGLAASQPWRCWTAAWVHWSDGHRWANVAAAALVAALGWRASCDRFDALAWFAAWPLTQLGLLLQPGLAHFGGLSGVLHAGVVIAGLSLLQRERGFRRVVGGAIVLGVVLKIVLEHPWRGALQRAPGWDIAIAPAAHVSGAAMGLACAAIAALWRRRGHAEPDGSPP
ncbi:MAG TPA: rhombosortase [Burkholderiaceae bacterium]|nr:rhombosortase [Burkholderiaceae bacterium]